MEVRFDFLYLILAIHNLIVYDEAAPRHQHAEQTKEKRRKWTLQEEADLIFYDVLTDTGEPNQLARIKSMWHEKYPDLNVTDSKLYRKILKLREESQEGERKKIFKWNQKLDQELLYVHQNTRPCKKKANMTIEEEWKRRHPDYQAAKKYLLERVRNLRRKYKLRGYGAQGSPNTDIEWNEQHDSDLSHAHNIALKDGKFRWRNIHQTWFELYPKYSHMTPEQLKKRVEHLIKNPPNKYFPWTKEQNKELLDIYDRTMPDVENQGQRIHDIWSEIHPQYKFMTPYYLQIHASTLAHERNIASGGYMRETWTERNRADLVNMYHQYPGRRREFHEEWVSKHPRRAYITAETLARLACRYAVKGVVPPGGEMEEESQSNTANIRRRRYEKYTPEEKQKMLDLYNRTDRQKLGHTLRIEKEMIKKQKDEDSIQGAPLKQYVRKWKGETSRKNFGKAPMFDSSNEAGPSSASRMSEESE